MEDDIATKIREALVRVDGRLARRELVGETSLVDDLGMDSIRLLDLTFAVQDLVGLREFPMQDWVDMENQRSGRRFTVDSLIAYCVARVRAESSELHPVAFDG